MKNFTLIVVLIFMLVTCFTIASHAQTYQNSIYTESIKDPQWEQSLDDLAAYLKKISKRDFSIRQYGGHIDKGIYILWNKPGLVSNELYKRISSGSIEDFILSGTDDHLLIIANHPVGFSHAIYTYLDRLGVKWYFPGAEWEYVPLKNDISIHVTQYFSPSFQLRNFFGTGDIRPISALDPTYKVKQQWNTWKRRNRMGGEVDLGGHYGEVFNIKYKDDLVKHPEYLASVNGKRVAWNTTVKWCISNKDLRKLFVADKVEELNAALAKRKYQSEKVVLSVDPADGGGDCECEYCKKLGSVSDRTFLLANEVAREFSKISPMASVNLYAYNTHAAPPKFELEPNVIVQIIPYAFQDVGTPEQMIALWKKKDKSLMIYDYYAIPDWHYEVPTPRKTSPDTLVKRIAYWKKQGIKGFLLESVFGFGNGGLGLYLMGRTGWDLNTNVESTKQEFYKNMFGGAADKMGQYFDYIGNEYQGTSDLPYLMDLLDQASRDAGSGSANRITQLQAYLHYLVLFQQWQSTSKENQQKAWEDLVQYVWEIYPLKVIHSTRIADLLFYGLDANSNALRNDWNIYEPYGQKLKKVKFIDSKEIADLEREDRKRYPLLEGFRYGNKSKQVGYVIKKQGDLRPGNSNDLLFRNFPDSYISSASSGYFEFFIRLNAEPSEKNGTYPLTITCADKLTGTPMVTKKEEVGLEWKKISIKLPQGKIFKLTLNFQPWVLIRIPNDQWIGFLTIPTYAVMSKLWFYVPANTKYLYYSNSAKEQPEFEDTQGNKISPQKVNDMNLFRLDTKAKGGWWNMTSSEYKFLQFYSVPDVFFTHPGYTVAAPKKN